MATPDVLFPITLPASDAGRKVTGHLRYIGADDLRSSAHGFTASSAIGHLTSIRAVDGLITFPDVTPNVLITSPTGTVYELVVEYWDGTRDEPEYATVGNVAGPVTWGGVNCELTAAPASLTPAGAVSSAQSRLAWASNPDLLIFGDITRDADGNVTSADVVWPDGTAGTFTATTIDDDGIEAYTITYGSPATATYTQPLMTRDADGAVVTRPEITVT